MENPPTKRAQRIQSPSILLPFKSPEGSITVTEVWREDILEWQPDDRFPSQWYLVLDFGVEQSFTITKSPGLAVDDLGEVTYIDTGRVQLDLQPLKIDSLDDWDPETGEGLGPPVARFADVPTDELGDLPGDEPRVGRPMTGWIPHPVSSRRPDRAVNDEPERCDHSGFQHVDPSDPGNRNGIFGKSVCPRCSGTGIVMSGRYPKVADGG